jgi:hypothetical protein
LWAARVHGRGVAAERGVDDDGAGASLTARRQARGSGAIVAEPRPSVRQLLAGHVVATVLVTAITSLAPTMIPLIALRRFGAGDWQTFLITAALPTLLVASIFWNAVLERISLPRYMLVYLAVGVLPLALMSLATSYAGLLVCHIIAAVGAAGWTPISGLLLQRFYPEAIRGRAFSAVNAAALISTMATVSGAGVWLSADGESFRVFLPLLAVASGIGLALLLWLAGRTGPLEPVRPGGARGLRSALLPLMRMGAILRADRRFARYERAFMTYGAGFMICDALLPLLVTRKLHMDYDQVATLAHVAMRSAMLAMAIPMGWALDRMGAARLSSVSFGWLMVYPLGLCVAQGALGLGVSSVLYGCAMAGVALGWMLGPVSLAPSPEKVSQYVAIHTTLVGVRGIAFQGLGMLLYQLTGSFVASLGIAAGAFLWAAIQMWSLGAAPEAAREAAPGAAELGASALPD